MRSIAYMALVGCCADLSWSFDDLSAHVASFDVDIVGSVPRT